MRERSPQVQPGNRSRGGAAPALCEHQAAHPHFARIFEQLRYSGGQFLSIPDVSDGIRLAKLAVDFGEVLHVRPGDDGASKDRRLQDVVTTPGDDRASHKHHAIERKATGELADRIQQQYRSVPIQIGAPDEIDSGGGELFCRLVEFLRLPRSQEHPGSGRHCPVSRDDRIVFVGRHRRGGDEQRMSFGPSAYGFRRGGGRPEVVLQVSVVRNIPRPQSRVPLPVALALRQNGIRQAQHRGEKPAEPFVSGQCAIGDSAVDDKEPTPEVLGLPPEIGPDLRLQHDHHSGPQPPQYPPDGPDKIERRIEYVRGVVPQSLFRHRPAGNCGTTDVHRTAGKLLAQLGNQPACGNYFTDRNCVQPDAAGNRRAPRQSSKPLAQVREITPVLESAP